MSTRPKILVADDDRDIVTLVAWALQDAGYATVEAQDGLEALRMTVQQDPDLLVLDLGMPGLEGDAVFRILRARGAETAPPVIFLTAKASAKDRAAGLTMGAADYMIKPFDVAELVARVGNTLARSGAPALSG